jgi:hypothetical protein
VLLIRLEEPLLMRGEWCTILLIQASMEGVREDFAIEAQTGLKEGGRVLNMIVNKGGQLLPTLAVGNSEKVVWGEREILQAALEVLLPPRAWVDMRLGSPVFFVIVKTR